jgi:Na+/proline symporter
MAGLGAGVLMPNVLRWYWARLNGWGYFAGIVTGMVLSLTQVVLENKGYLHQPVFVTFPALALSVMVVAIAVALITPPTDAATLKRFYRDVQPAGAWGDVARAVAAEDPAFRKEPFAPDLVNVAIAVIWLAALYTAPVLLVTHQMTAAAIAGVVVLVLTVVLVFTWWPRLPKADEAAAEEGK